MTRGAEYAPQVRPLRGYVKQMSARIIHVRQTRYVHTPALLKEDSERGGGRDREAGVGESVQETHRSTRIPDLMGGISKVRHEKFKDIKAPVAGTSGQKWKPDDGKQVASLMLPQHAHRSSFSTSHDCDERLTVCGIHNVSVSPTSQGRMVPSFFSSALRISESLPPQGKRRSTAFTGAGTNARRSGSRP